MRQCGSGLVEAVGLGAEQPHRGRFQIACSVNNIGVILPHLKGGRARVLATSGAKRSRFTPNVPTFVEAGYKDVEAQEWFGFVMPSKVPPAKLVYELTAE